MTLTERMQLFRHRFRYYRGLAHQAHLYKPIVNPRNPHTFIKIDTPVVLPPPGPNGR